LLRRRGVGRRMPLFFMNIRNAAGFVQEK